MLCAPDCRHSPDGSGKSNFIVMVQLGPNVSIGAYVKVHEGVRIVNSIILEDAEI